MRKVIRTVKTPKDSFLNLLKEVKDPLSASCLSTLKKKIGLYGQWLGNSKTKKTSLVFEEFLMELFDVDNIDSAQEVSNIRISQELKEYYDSIGSPIEFEAMHDQHFPCFAGKIAHPITIFLSLLLANKLHSFLNDLYMIWSAKELSPSKRLVEELSYCDTSFSLDHIPFLSWVSLKNTNLRSTPATANKVGQEMHRVLCTWEEEDHVSQLNTDTIEGVMVLNLNEYFNRCPDETKLFDKVFSLLDSVESYDEEDYNKYLEHGNIVESPHGKVFEPIVAGLDSIHAQMQLRANNPFVMRNFLAESILSRLGIEDLSFKDQPLKDHVLLVSYSKPMLEELEKNWTNIVKEIKEDAKQTGEDTSYLDGLDFQENREKIHKSLVRSNLYGSSFLLSHIDEVEDKIELLMEGLGDSLEATFQTCGGRRLEAFKIDTKETIFTNDNGYDYSDFGMAFSLALKSLKYSYEANKNSSTEYYEPPVKVKQTKQTQRKKKGKNKKVKVVNDYYQIEYLKVPTDAPEWFASAQRDRKETTKSIDPRFMSSHYRRIWVTDSYIKKHDIPDEQVLSVDDNRPRKSPKGTLVYKKRSLVAIKIDTGHDPILTVSRLG